ncbi:MAG: hypothetical protein ACOYBR_02180 [Fluviibacter sp.]
MNSLITYVVAFFLVGGLGGLLASIVAMPILMILGRLGSGIVTISSWLMGFASGWLAVYIGTLWFQWMKVDFGYLALIAIFVPLLYNDNRRAQGGAPHEKAVLAGTVSSLLFFGFLMAAK